MMGKEYFYREKDILKLLWKEEMLSGGEAEEIPPIPRDHGCCCTCQTCGRDYDDCVCDHNEMVKGLKAIKKGCVYQLTDVTDEDNHYAFGLFTTLDDAIAAINRPDVSALSPSFDDCPEYLVIKIYRMELGINFNEYNVVYTRELEYLYSEEEDKSTWVITKEVKSEL